MSVIMQNWLNKKEHLVENLTTLNGKIIIDIL